MFEIKENKLLLDKILKSNLLPLAFIGDSVHTLFVREYCLIKYDCKMQNYHNEASKFCKASAQAKVLNQLIPLLNDDESEIVRRGRNARPKHQAKNASSADYSFATAFEILVGYLYLKGETKRLEEILNKSITLNF